MAITFAELRQLLTAHRIELEREEESDFDPPRAGAGALFPISRGMLQAASICEDLLQGDAAAASGRENFVEAIREFAMGRLDVRLLEILCCHGCIMGRA